MKRLTVVLAGALALAACQEAPEPPTAPGDQGPPGLSVAPGQQADAFVEGRVLARFEPGANAAAVARAHGATIQRDVVLGIKMLKVPAGQERAVAAALARSPNVEFAEPDYIRTFGDPAVVSVSDPYFGYKWDHDNDGNIYDSGGSVLATTGSADADMDWLEAFDAQGGVVNGSAVIGIIDSGILHNHEELAGRIQADYDFFAGDGDAADDYGHGTHVAGIAAAATDNGVGVSGVAFASDARFVVAKVCGYTNPISYGCPTSAIAEGITWAVDNGAHAINLSDQVRDVV